MPYCFSTGKTYFFRFPDLSSEGGCYRFWKNALILEGTTKGDDFTKGAIRFRADLKLDLQGGKSVAGDTLLSVTNANSATIYIAMATNFVNYKDISGNPSERNKISMKNAGKIMPELYRLISMYIKNTITVYL